MAKAELYRMVMPDHLCPSGLKSKWLLERKGFDVADHPLTTRPEVDAYKEAAGVETTPQTFIDGERVGGWEDLRRYFGWTVKDKDALTYRPVIAIFAVAFVMALAVAYAMDSFGAVTIFQKFIAIAMCLLGVQKLQDVETFSSMFLGYDVVARKWVPYAYAYPYLETLAGVLMLAGALLWLAAPIGIFIGAVGSWSVIKAVYIEKRSLKCACVGGGKNVPLGPVTLLENGMMLLMGLWMLGRVIT